VSTGRPGSGSSLCRQAGFGLVELIMAMTLLAVGVLGLAAAAALAARSLNGAAATGRATRAAAAVIDSLLHAGVPSAGERLDDGVIVRWDAAGDSGLILIRATVEISDPSGTRHIDYDAARMRHVPE
jgi:type II secretory pathway pseudopilin PulG